MQEGRQPASPIKETTWKWYIPIYFWLGGISAGSWVAATAEDLVGENDRDLVRTARYLALGGVLGGTALLILDLGRRDRFLNMLRILRTRSTMSLGAWGLTGFGALTGFAALLQTAEDGMFGRRPALARLSWGRLGRAVHVTGLPAALFVGSYTGVLLASTSTPSWARRTLVLGPLFLSSGLAGGFAALGGVLQAAGSASDAAQRRLARAESMALAAELVLGAVSQALARSLPSGRNEPVRQRLLRRLAVGIGMIAPLAMRVRRSLAEARAERTCGAHARCQRERAPLARATAREGSRAEIARAAITLSGSLALRYLIMQEGRRSARTADDTWAIAASRGREPAVRLGRGEQRAKQPRRRPASLRGRSSRGEVVGVIVVVQEDRIRVVSANGRGYLFTVRKRRASLEDLERWRDDRTPVHVRYSGIPDAGATAEEITAVVTS